MFIQPKNRLAFILENARWRALPQSVISATLAICLALNSNSFNILFALLGLLGVVCAPLKRESS